MTFEVIFTEIAEQHIAEACEYYDSLPYQNITANFLDDLDTIISQIELNPFFQVWTDEFRATPLQKFPYLVFFELIEEQNVVKIVAIFHTSQNPEKYPQ
ncbi:MAG: type II toxin-antitoxin system RelE/ParE family toxin [Chitinophagales bacterium]|jgi:toxin ParE1/3/4|nr:type II toxin-antitoxin system RelE/ParE family toxin [Sphingobacteriales bacterium]